MWTAGLVAKGSAVACWLACMFPRAMSYGRHFEYKRLKIGLTIKQHFARSVELLKSSASS